jgi:hypothetical protein
MSKIWFVKRVISDTYYNIKNGIPNLIKWFPVVWRNRWWDHYFIFDVLHKQLTLMEKNIREYGHHVYNERDARQIKIAILLIERIMKDEYHENVFRHHDKKWGETHFNWKDVDGKEFGYKDQMSVLDITRDNAITKEQKDQERKEFRRLSPKVEEQKKQDIDFLFDYMKKHIQGWWD